MSNQSQKDLGGQWRNKPPFNGLLVLDLTQIYNGPYATFLLAQAGATVIKIEPPDGEHLRKRADSGVQAVTVPYAMLNANKLSMSLNLKNEKARINANELFMYVLLIDTAILSSFFLQKAIK